MGKACLLVLPSGALAKNERIILAIDEYPYKVSSSKKTIYKLSDTMFQFWYRFIPANLALIAMGAAERAYQRIEAQLSAYMGFVFEEMCKQYLWQENLKGNLPIDFTDMGRWWGNDTVEKKQTEIDILADNDENEAIFAECKWRNEPVGEKELKDLQHQSTPWEMYFYLIIRIWNGIKSGGINEEIYLYRSVGPCGRR